MNCPICHQEIKDDSKFCSKCGSKIPRCPTCGKVLYKKTRFCIGDGTPIPEEILNLLPAENAQAASLLDKINKAARAAAQEMEPSEPAPSTDAAGAEGETASGSERASAAPDKALDTLLRKRFCVKCGNPCENGETLCPKCKQLSTQGKKPHGNSAPQKNKKKKSIVPIVIIVVILLLLLLVGGIIGYFVINGGFFTSDQERNAENHISSSEIVTDRSAADDESEPEDSESEEITDTEEPAEEQPAEEEPVETEETAEETEILEPETPLVIPESDPIEEIEAAPPVSMKAVTEITATSELSEYDMTHTASLAIDGDVATGWVEGVDGQGIGETITLYLSDTYTVTGFAINAGYQKSDSLYEKNSRPAQICVTFSGGESETFTLDDINGEQRIVFSLPHETNSVSITIISVYEGSKYEDTVISEISLF